MIKFLDLRGQYDRIREDIDAAVAKVLSDATFIGGPAVRAFEEAFAGYVGVPHCIGVANGTDALEIIIEALELPRGSEIILPANSFIATSEAVSRCGHRIVFADVSPNTYVLDVEDVRRRLTADTRAVIAVHLYGHPAPMAELNALASEHNLSVIEDAAQAHGTELGGVRAGGLSTAAAFSFYPGKTLGAYGDGGAITTRDADLAVKLRRIANHGRVAKYDHIMEGRNSRLDTLQAAILSAKLPHLDSWIARRNEIAAVYDGELSGVPGLTLGRNATGARHSYHLYVVRTARRDELASFLKSQGIETGVHYPTALPRLDAYRAHPQHTEAFFSVDAASQLLSLPIGDHLVSEDARLVAKAVRDFFASSL